MLHKELWMQAEKYAVHSLVHMQHTHIASTWTQLDVTMWIVIRAKSVAMQQNVNTQWFLECRNIYQMYFTLCVIMINVLKVYSISVILGRELGPSGVSPHQRSRWKLAFLPLKHV